MEKAPNYEQLRALREIQDGPLDALLRDWLDEIMSGIALVKDEVAMRWKQGQVQALNIILKHIEQSKDKLHSIYNSRRQVEEMRKTSGNGSRFVE